MRRSTPGVDEETWRDGTGNFCSAAECLKRNVDRGSIGRHKTDPAASENHALIERNAKKNVDFTLRCKKVKEGEWSRRASGFRAERFAVMRFGENFLAPSGTCKDSRSSARRSRERIVKS